MGQSKTIATYTDVEAIFDTILRQDIWPAKVECLSHKAAITWRARAHAFRSILRRMEEEDMGMPRGRGTSRFDSLILNLKAGARFVTIERRTIQTKLTLADQEVDPVSDRVLFGEPTDDGADS